MKRLVCFVAFAGLIACSSVTEPMGMEDPFGIPQPFKGKERNDDMIAQAIRVPALVVAVPGGLAEERGQALRDRVVELAQASDIPALSSASVRAWSLSGEAALIETPAMPGKGKKKQAKGSQGVIIWRLADPDGAERAKFSVKFKAVQETLGDADLRIVAQDTVNALDAALLRPDTQVSQTIIAAEKPVAWVGSVRGAPGDGNQALTRALTGILPMKGVMLGATQAKAQWRIEGVVKVAPGANGQDIVTLTWRVLDAQGREAGSITQENTVPRGRLAKPWREIAGFAAEAAAEGIAQLIQQVTAATQG
jgi:hypothetical protein